jgi:hypothetical protein
LVRRLSSPIREDIYKKSSLDLALRDAFHKMRSFLMNTKGLSEDEAISLISVAVDFGATQLVDGIHAIVKKKNCSPEPRRCETVTPRRSIFGLHLGCGGRARGGAPLALRRYRPLDPLVVAAPIRPVLPSAPENEVSVLIAAAVPQR